MLGASSGNHAQALALAGRLLAAAVTVVVPRDAPVMKVNAAASLGAQVVRYDRHADDRDAMTRALAAEHGYVIVPSADDRFVMAGACTVTLELLEQAPHLAVILVPVGGGGLAVVNRHHERARPEERSCRAQGRTVRFGLVVPHADAREFAQVAELAEQHGWDGIFTWEAVWGVHAWVTLGAATMVTERMTPRSSGQHPPVWVVGAYVTGRDRQPSLDRAARWDGLLPQIIEAEDRRHVHDPGELADLLARVRPGAAMRSDWAMRRTTPLSKRTAAVSSSSSARPIPATWAAAGATWWIESWWSVPRGAEGLAEVRRRVQSGPPAAS